jgi:probable phosphoglycerate mutase
VVRSLHPSGCTRWCRARDGAWLPRADAPGVNRRRRHDYRRHHVEDAGCDFVQIDLPAAGSIAAAAASAPVRVDVVAKDEGSMQLLLVRHAATEDIGVRLCGRLPGVRLSAIGARQAHALAARLQTMAPSAIYCSPLERALQTAAPIARACGVKITIEPDLVEIDFGAWTGATFARLAADPDWLRFRHRPSRARIPQGEKLADVADRAARVLRRIARRHDGRAIAISHLDVLRLGVARLLSRPIDAFRSCEIEPAGLFLLQCTGTHVAVDPGQPPAPVVRQQAS